MMPTALRLALLLVAAPLAAQSPAMPRPDLTPGDVITSDTAKLCHGQYATKARQRLSTATRVKLYVRYGIPRSNLYRLDDLVPIELGGRQTARNLWPEPYRESLAKDSAENYVKRLVCRGRVSITRAQSIFATRWTDALVAERAKSIP